MVNTLDKTTEQTKLRSQLAERQQVNLQSHAPSVGRYASVANDSKRDVATVNALVNGVFADGVVTSNEMDALNANRDDVVYDFIVAVDVYNDMKKSGMYSQAALDNAHYVMMQLKIARDVSYSAVNRAAHYNNATPEEVKRRAERREQKETIQLALLPVEVALMTSLADDFIKLAYQDDKEKARPLTADERQQRTDRVQAMFQEVAHNRTPSLILAHYQQRQNA